MINVDMKAPFPWFGGKSLAAELIWSRFGVIKNYVEPFFGSGAVLLQAPETFDGAVVLNDLDGLICNFWRSIQYDPEKVAFYATAQVNEIDLQARHQYLVDIRSALTESLKSDPDYFDPKIAGWWAWGCCCWIGGGWCEDKGKGVDRRIPHIGNKGRGVNKQIPHIGNKGRGQFSRAIEREYFLSEWFIGLQSRFFDARICCGDWQRICTPTTIACFGMAGILLDPPYGTTQKVYAKDSDTVAIDVQDWCKKNGLDPNLRIALCGHVGQHESLEDLGWAVESPKKGGGYQGADDRERIWFSPNCLGSLANFEQLDLIAA